MTTAKTHTANARAKAPRTASKEERRKQLIDATIASIRKYGISGTTMTTITKIAGLSTGLANFHFKSKEILFQETLRFLAEEHHEQWKKSYEQAKLAPEAKLMAIVAAHFHPKICSRKKIAVWYGFFGEASARASYRLLVNEIDAERRELSTRLCKQIIAEGGYVTVDADDVTYSLEGLYDGFWLNILMYPGEFTRFDAMKRIQVYLAQVFPDHFSRPA
ncbi:transcriptional regulator, TetR family [Shimia gijangensis]|uniref:Transcriptional regulator, TetR family n=1 Tax=Shimia gijangensis TaxID=1470563 RepID=A0A1M6S0G9_9RHOB|nr:TetR family transcriptional regulator C-terminal domain-containing protein [Shimia gijangensis]SHK38264.1 transcriptional regulator, TetR family [Shimia gijangensis]